MRQAERDQDVRPGLMPPRVKQDAELTPEIRRVFDEVGIPFADLSDDMARICWFSDDRAVGRRIDGDGLLGETVEQEAPGV